nr:tapasin-related protein [Nothobranchius furzeri]
MMIEVIFFGCLMAFINADGVADVVLSCALVEEGVGLGGVALFTRTPSTLVLRDVPVGLDESLDTLTPFVPPLVPDPDLLLFETKVSSSPDIPNAEVLLHADCNEQEVTCEISRYTPRGLQESSDPAYFMVFLSVEGLDFSMSLILQTLSVEKHQPALIQKKLSLPLSSSGTLQTKGIFLVFSNKKSVLAPLRGDILLNCGFKQEEVPLGADVGVEWRLQHRGKGHKVLEMKKNLDDTKGTVLHGERKGSSMDAAQLASQGNVSMSLTQLKVADEGTYICTVSVGRFHAQQVIQLHIYQPPQVSLSDEKLKTSQTLSCHSRKYYPLDAQMQWFYLSPSDSKEQLFPDQGSLSSHRQHGDGTYSLSSYLTVSPSVSPGTKVICRVNHPVLDSPVDVIIVVESPQPDSYWFVLGFLIITVLFFYQVIK